MHVPDRSCESTSLQQVDFMIKMRVRNRLQLENKSIESVIFNGFAEYARYGGDFSKG